MFWVKTQSLNGTKEAIPQKEKTFFLSRWRRWLSGYRVQRKVCSTIIGITTQVSRNVQIYPIDICFLCVCPVNGHDFVATLLK